MSEKIYSGKDDSVKAVIIAFVVTIVVTILLLIAGVF